VSRQGPVGAVKQRGRVPASSNYRQFTRIVCPVSYWFAILAIAKCGLTSAPRLPQAACRRCNGSRRNRSGCRWGLSPKVIFCGRIAYYNSHRGDLLPGGMRSVDCFGFAPDDRLARVMCDCCEKLDVEIERLERQAEGAGPDMLPAIELMIAVRQARRNIIECGEER